MNRDSQTGTVRIGGIAAAVCALLLAVAAQCDAQGTAGQQDTVKQSTDSQGNTSTVTIHNGPGGKETSEDGEERGKDGKLISRWHWDVDKDGDVIGGQTWDYYPSGKVKEEERFGAGDPKKQQKCVRKVRIEYDEQGRETETINYGAIPVRQKFEYPDNTSTTPSRTTTEHYQDGEWQSGLAQSTTATGEDAEDQTMLAGVVLPRDIRTGDTVSGRIVTDISRYREDAALQVVEVRVPVESTLTEQRTTTTALLQTTEIDSGNGRLQSGGDSFTATIPKDAANLPLRIVSTDGGRPLLQTEISVKTATPVAESETAAPHPAQDYTENPVLVDTAPQAIRGPLSGDSAQTHIAVDGKPANIVAESPREVFYRLPAGTKPGEHAVGIDDGDTHAAFDEDVLHASLSSPELTLERGASTTLTATVSGPEKLSADAWKHAAPPTELADAAKLFPAAKAISADNEGSVLFRIENQSKGTVTLAGGDVAVMNLSRQSFEHGPYVYRTAIQSLRTGSFKISAVAVSCIQPVEGHSPGTRTEEETPPVSQDTETESKTWRQVDVSGPGAKTLNQNSAH